MNKLCVMAAVLTMTGSAMADYQYIRGCVPRGNGVTQRRVNGPDGRWGIYSPGARRVVAVNGTTSPRAGTDALPAASNVKTIIIYDDHGHWGIYSPVERRIVSVGTGPMPVNKPDSDVLTSPGGSAPGIPVPEAPVAPAPPVPASASTTTDAARR